MEIHIEGRELVELQVGVAKLLYNLNCNMR